MLFRARRIRTLALLVVVLLSWSEVARALDVMGIDVSHWQGTITWPNVAADNIKFAFMKATEDTNYTDPTFSDNLTNATNAGVLVGPYHFCRLDSGSSNPSADGVAEANYFLSRIKPKYLTKTLLPPVADVETWPSGLSTADLKTLTSTWMTSFSDTIYNSLGVRPLIYTSQSKATTLFNSTVAAANPLWVANWKGTGITSPPTNASVSPFSTWKFWQWSNGSDAIATGDPVNGVPGRVDRDVFNGNLAQLKALLLGKDATAKPGDFNRDSVVNLADYNLWVADNGKTVPIYTGADADGDARVTSADLSFYLANVPEPASCLLMLIGMCAAALGSLRTSRRAARRA